MRNSNYILFLLFIFVLPFHLSYGQRPISQVEGILEVYNDIDSTSTYIGKNVGRNVEEFHIHPDFYLELGDFNNSFLGSQSGAQNTIGHDNTLIGYGSGTKNTTGSWNSFIGSNSGYNTTTGSSNTFIGNFSGYHNTAGSLNTYMGNYSGRSNQTGEYNAYYGFASGTNNKGSKNSFFGFRSGTSLFGEENTAIGYRSGSGILNGSKNIIIGHEAGPNTSSIDSISNRLYIDVKRSNNSLIYGEFDNDLIRINGDLEITGSIILTPMSNEGNSFYGAHAGEENVGYNNTFMGHRSGNNNSTGRSNSFFGSNAGKSNTDGELNTYIGSSAGISNTSGYSNTFIGSGAGWQNTTGAFNTFLGEGTGGNITQGDKNIILGNYAGPTSENNLISNKLFVDIETSNTPLIYGEFDNDLIRINGDLAITGSLMLPTGDTSSIYIPETPDSIMSPLLLSNVIVGSEAGHSLSNGTANTMIGRNSGSSTESGNANVYLGHSAGRQMTNANNNVLIGYLAGENVDGSGNVFIGNKAGQKNTLTSLNNRLHIANGPNPLIYGEFDNQVIRINGELQLESNKFNIRNIGGSDNGTGLIWSEDENPAFGLVYDGVGTGDSNRLHLREFFNSDSDIVTYKANGNIGIGVTDPQENLDVQGNIRIRNVGSLAAANDIRIDAQGNLTTSMSDIRLKENVTVLPDALDRISKIRGVSFTWKSDPNAGIQHGIIAQDVRKVAPELVFEKNGFLGVDYSELIGILIESIKALKLENESLKSRITIIENR